MHKFHWEQGGTDIPFVTAGQKPRLILVVTYEED